MIVIIWCIEMGSRTVDLERFLGEARPWGRAKMFWPNGVRTALAEAVRTPQAERPSRLKALPSPIFYGCRCSFGEDWPRLQRFRGHAWAKL